MFLAHPFVETTGNTSFSLFLACFFTFAFSHDDLRPAPFSSFPESSFVGWFTPQPFHPLFLGLS